MNKLDAVDIKHRMSETDKNLSDWYKKVKEWDQMYALNPGNSKSWQEMVEELGREQVITPDPYDIVHLAMRLVATDPFISQPPRSERDDHRDSSEKVERWLMGAWQQASRQQGRNVVADLTWQALVRGCNALQVQWVEDKLPKKHRERSFPLMFRSLEPVSVGIKRGPLWTEWAFSKRMDDTLNAKQLYPHLKAWKEDKYDDKTVTHEVEVVDFWHTDPKTGAVRNTVMVAGEVVQETKEMDAYPFIPILMGYGDSAPSENELYKRLSILHGINGLWQYKCRLMSNMGTAILWNTWPHYFLSNENGETLRADIKVRPGQSEVVPWGTKVDVVQPQANLGDLQRQLDAIERNIQQSTFPAVMFGDAGSMQAGYGVQQLQASAKNRTQGTRESLELIISQANELALCLVEELGPDEGVELWARDSRERSKSYSERLYKEDIDGYYRNVVNLEPNLPQDDIQRIVTGLRLVEAQIISFDSFRNIFMGNLIPANEDEKVFAEQAVRSEEMLPRMQAMALKAAYPDEFRKMIAGSSLEQLAITIGILQPEEPEQPEQGPFDGMSMDNMAMMPPDMMQPPMGDPTMMQPPPMGDPMAMQQPPDMGAPIQPPMELVPPMGGGIPPALQGQLEGENVGLGPVPDPLAMQALLQGQPLPPEEELDMLMQQSGGMPPGV